MLQDHADIIQRNVQNIHITPAGPSTSPYPKLMRPQPTPPQATITTPGKLAE